MKKIKMTANGIGINNPISNKPSTVTRAGITAQIKPSRGKELVEHAPMLLIPDPNNPRPGDIINDDWLIENLFIGKENCLCRFDTESNDFLIPSVDQLSLDLSKETQEHYSFLRSLAYSIRYEGLIEPIEIFLADKNNDPEYFINSTLDYGYVVLEGHQRRLAAIMARVNTVTCIQITDETMLAKLKVKHRKLRRQLSENNLRKGLTVSQNFKIVKSLLESMNGEAILVKDLSSIIGLNEDISGALKRLAIDADNYPMEMLKAIENNRVSFKWIRTWISKSYAEIQLELNRLNGDHVIKKDIKEKVKARGKSGGAIKRSATFKVHHEQDSEILQGYLFRKIPELKVDLQNESSFNNLEKLLNKILELAKHENPTQVGLTVTQ